MHALGQAVRFLVPLALGALLFIGPRLPPGNIAPMREGTSLLVLILIVVSLMRFPRLWVLAPGLVITRIAVDSGGMDWMSWVEYTGTMQIAIPLVLIGVTSAIRRLPSPVPNAPGTIVPNADGIGSLLALPVALPLAINSYWLWLTVLALAFAGYRIFDYGRKHTLFTRGRGWLAFLAAMAAGMAASFYWARPDWALGWIKAQQSCVVFGVVAWAMQRAIIPWRNLNTVP